MEAIFSHPTPNNLEWRKIEALFVALKAEVIESNGSVCLLSLIMKKVIFTGRTQAKKQSDIK